MKKGKIWLRILVMVMVLGTFGCITIPPVQINMGSGLSTGFAPTGLKGGYSDKVGDYEYYLQITRNEILQELGHDILFEVKASGNAYTSEGKVKAILLGRCGQLAIQNECKYFYIIDSDSSVRTTVETRANTNTSLYSPRRNKRGNINANSTTTTTTSTVEKHEKWAVIVISEEMIDGWDHPYNAQKYYGEALTL